VDFITNLPETVVMKLCDSVRYLKLSRSLLPIFGGPSNSLRKELRIVLARLISPALRSLTIDYCGTFGDPYCVFLKPFLSFSNIPALSDLAVLKVAFDEPHMASSIELNGHGVERPRLRSLEEGFSDDMLRVPKGLQRNHLTLEFATEEFWDTKNHNTFNTDILDYEIRREILETLLRDFEKELANTVVIQPANLFQAWEKYWTAVDKEFGTEND
jgi:hypothetical protein